MFSISIVNRVVGACGLFISVFALAACDSDPTPTFKATANARSAPTSGGDVDYQLGANDRVRIIVFGQPTLTGTTVLGDWTEAGLLSLVAAAELGSEHPLGEAVVTAARYRSLPLPPVR